MPLLIFVLIIVLIAQIGFWDTFGAILGAVGMILLLILLALAIVILGIRMLYRRRFR